MAKVQLYIRNSLEGNETVKVTEKTVQAGEEVEVKSITIVHSTTDSNQNTGYFQVDSTSNIYIEAYEAKDEYKSVTLGFRMGDTFSTYLEKVKQDGTTVKYKKGTSDEASVNARFMSTPHYQWQLSGFVNDYFSINISG